MKKLKEILNRIYIIALLTGLSLLAFGVIAFFWWLDHIRFIY